MRFSEPYRFLHHTARISDIQEGKAVGSALNSLGSRNLSSSGMTVPVTVIDPFGTMKALNAGSRRPIMG